MNILFIDGVGPFGGACRSLYEAVRGIKQYGVNAYFIAAKGTAVPFYAELADEVIATQGLTRFDNSKCSYYHGIRWLIVFRELFHLPFMLLSILQAKRLWREIDIIHANEISEIIPAMLAKILFKIPVVIHVRSLQRGDTRSWRSRWINSMLRKADAVIAIDENVRMSLPADLEVIVIHNSFTAIYEESPDHTFIKQLEKCNNCILKVGFVGNLLLSKGLFDLLDAAKIVSSKMCGVKFLIVGGVTRNDSGLKSWVLKKLGLEQNIRQKLLKKICEYDLQDSFLLLGPTSDIQRAYESFDVLCFPSHFDAPGRPVFEAYFSGKPSIVAVNDPQVDTLIHGQTGLAIPPKNPEQLAAAILHFVNDPAEAKRMGNNAKKLAQLNFDPSKNAKKILDVYQRLLACSATIKR